MHSVMSKLNESFNGLKNAGIALFQILGYLFHSWKFFANQQASKHPLGFPWLRLSTGP